MDAYTPCLDCRDPTCSDSPRSISPEAKKTVKSNVSHLELAEACDVCHVQNLLSGSWFVGTLPMLVSIPHSVPLLSFSKRCFAPEGTSTNKNSQSLEWFHVTFQRRHLRSSMAGVLSDPASRGVCLGDRSFSEISLRLGKKWLWVKKQVTPKLVALANGNMD